MRTHRIIFIIGILLVIVPFLGIPSDWKMIVVVILGAVLVLFGLAIKLRHVRQSHTDSSRPPEQKTFVEHVPQDHNSDNQAQDTV